MRHDNDTTQSWLPWVLTGLVAGGAALTLVASKRQRKDRESRTEDQRAIESDRAHEASPQARLDGIGELSLKHDLGESAKDDSIVDIARARTLTVLRQLDGQRKGLLLRFLYELDLGSELIRRQVGPEGKEDERVAVAAPRGANLAGTELKGTDLRSARLVGTSLVAAGLECAQLVGASLKGADLRGTNLTGAEPTRAYLASVDLAGARVTDGQLAQAGSPKGATMPDVRVHG